MFWQTVRFFSNEPIIIKDLIRSVGKEKTGRTKVEAFYICFSYADFKKKHQNHYSQHTDCRCGTFASRNYGTTDKGFALAFIRVYGTI